MAIFPSIPYRFLLVLFKSATISVCKARVLQRKREGEIEGRNGRWYLWYHQKKKEIFWSQGLTVSSTAEKRNKIKKSNAFTLNEMKLKSRTNHKIENTKHCNSEKALNFNSSSLDSKHQIQKKEF